MSARNYHETPPHTTTTEQSSNTLTNRERLCDLGYEDSVIFDFPDYDDAIVGVTDDGRVVYDYEKMVQCLSEELQISPIEAIDYIEFNTIRALAYQEDGPIIIHTLQEAGL